jgi:hypothetical protein
MTQMIQRPRVRERKLGREKACGLFWAEGRLGMIEIDPRLPAKDRLETVVHECLHNYNRRWSEAKVTKTAADIAKILWRDRYRRIEK